jgi:hypothetical protein
MGGHRNVNQEIIAERHMLTWDERILNKLRPYYHGRWQMWTVLRYQRGNQWCARPWDQRCATAWGESPEELVASMSDYERDHPSEFAKLAIPLSGPVDLTPDPT